MTGGYVPAAEAWRKLNYAKNMKTSAYIWAATGYGKTRLVREFLKNEESLWLSPADEVWEIPESADRVLNVVIDDLQKLHENDRVEMIRKMMDRPDLQVFLIGRMRPPIWVIPYLPQGKVVILSEEDLRLKRFEIRKIAGNEDIPLSDEDILTIEERTRGNAFAVSASIQLLKTETYGMDEIQTRLTAYFEDYIETQVIPEWSIQLQEFLMQISVVEEFTLPLAVMITGDDQAASLIEEAFAVGNFLTVEGDIYRLRPELCNALRRKAEKILGLEKINSCRNNAGLYFEMQGNVPQALSLYEEAGNRGSIRSLLIRNARRNPGMGHYYELRKYYLELEEKEIQDSPMLMNAMSMLCSMLMDAEQSEYWLGKLKEYAKNTRGGEKREAEELAAYLELALPHKGSSDMLEKLQAVAKLIRIDGIKIPPLSLTNNQPSVMNGGKDFCEWSKKDIYIAGTFGKIIEKVLGPSGKGLTHAALSESYFEKGIDDTDCARCALMVQMDTEGSNDLQMLFVAVGIQVRMSLLKGNAKNADMLLSAFEKRLQKDSPEMMKKNFRALKCRTALVTGDRKTVEDWMSEAPDEMVEFLSLERYRYMTKARCYISRGKNLEALSLLERLRYYADYADRPYLKMESGILQTIAMRTEKMNWKPIFMESLKKAEEYSFVRVLSEKGAGILPLLKEIRKEYLASEGANGEWFARVLKEAERNAALYPGYLNSETVRLSDFSDTAIEILSLQAAGKNIREIAEILGMSERNVKYHAAENYRKLEAKGKTDAVQIARRLHIIP